MKLILSFFVFGIILGVILKYSIDSVIREYKDYKWGWQEANEQNTFREKEGKQ